MLIARIRLPGTSGLRLIHVSVFLGETQILQKEGLNTRFVIVYKLLFFLQLVVDITIKVR
jgi:hypothetical protein